MDEQEGRADLCRAAEQRPGDEGCVRRRQRIAGKEVKAGDEEERERHAEPEAHEGRAGRPHHALEMLLHRRSHVLEKRGGYRDRDPEFHDASGLRPQV